MSSAAIALLLPTRNRAALLPRALDSIARAQAHALASTGLHSQLAVIDNGSSDATASPAESKPG